MVAERRVITVSEDELRRIVTDVVKTSVQSVDSLPMCAVENNRIKQIEDGLSKAVIILTGNGDPSHGLVYKFSLIERDVKRITSGIWAFVVVAVGLIVTAVWNIILTVSP